MRGDGRNLGYIFATVQLLTKKPRTTQELADLVGINKETATVYVKAMVAEGLAEQVGRAPCQKAPGSGPGGSRQKVYGWCAQ